MSLTDEEYDWWMLATDLKVEVKRLREALPDPDNLDLLADWFDLPQNKGAGDEVQEALRAWAAAARQVLADHRE